MLIWLWIRSIELSESHRPAENPASNLPQRQSRVLMPAAKGKNSGSPASVRSKRLPSPEPHRQKNARWHSLTFPQGSPGFMLHEREVHFCVLAHLLVCFFQRVSWTQTGFPREGFGVRRYPPFICSCAFWAFSDHQVQIACALLLRRARSIRSLPRDAIGRSVVDAHDSLSVGSKL
jgi:hypothetical protein